MGSIRLLRATQLFCLVLFVFPATMGYAEDGILRTIRNAQAANQVAFPHGRLILNAETVREGWPTISRKIELSWSQEQCRATVHNVPPPRADQVARIEVPPSRWIENRRQLIVHNEGNKTAVISPSGDYEPPDEIFLFPKRTWYGPLGHPGGSTWLDLLDPAVRPPRDGDPFEREVKRPSDDEIVVEFRSDRFKSRGSITFRESLNYNVTQYEMTNSVSVVTGECQWVGAGPGLARLQRAREVETFSKPIRQRVINTIEITSFDPDTVPPPSTFELASLKLPKGTFVDDRIKGRRSVIGGRSTDEVSRSLEPLIERMRSRGFSSPRDPN